MPETLIIGNKIGGQPKQRYWTPDGREILAAPCMRGTSEGGVRDANYDKGWLPNKPKELKLYCPHCALWHDTKLEITECGAKKRKYDMKYLKKAKKDISKNGEGQNEEIETLKSEMAEIKNLLTQLVSKSQMKKEVRQ